MKDETKKKRVLVKRRRMVHIHDPNFHKKKDMLTGIVLYTNSVLPVNNPDKKYFLNVTKLFLDRKAERIPFFPKVEEKDVDNFVSERFGISTEEILFTKCMYRASNLDIYFVEINFNASPKLDGFITHNILDMYSDKTVDCIDLFTNIIRQKNVEKCITNGHLRKKLGGQVIGGESLPITIKQEAIYKQMIGAFEINI
jgi:hypothetical protein